MIVHFGPFRWPAWEGGKEHPGKAGRPACAMAGCTHQRAQRVGYIAMQDGSNEKKRHHTRPEAPAVRSLLPE